jgi:hypothetical protein
MLMLDEEGSENAFNQIIDLWIIPEIESRKERGIIDDKFVSSSNRKIEKLDSIMKLKQFWLQD